MIQSLIDIWQEYILGEDLEKEGLASLCDL